MEYLKTDISLRRCRSCRCKPRLFRSDGLITGYGVECKGCGKMIFLYPTIEEAIDAWNKEATVK